MNRRLSKNVRHHDAGTLQGVLRGCPASYSRGCAGRQTDELRWTHPIAANNKGRQLQRDVIPRGLLWNRQLLLTRRDRVIE